MAQIIIDGFPNVEAAIEFFDWYEGQGEQDFSMWMDCQEEGVLSSANVDLGSDVADLAAKTFTFKIKPFLKDDD